MSTSSRRRANDDGFSLVEIVVAMGLIAVVLTASLPMFLSLLRSTLTTKLNTQAKNLSQERLEHVRDLRFHVDRQNGPFLDLLDIYYTHAKASTAAIAVPAGTQTLTGKYVAAGTGTGGEPTGPYYRVTTGPLIGAGDFQQVIATQFLSADGRSVLPATGVANVYDSQVVGKDSPPTLMLGVTVITTWQEAGATKSYRTYTQVTEGKPDVPLIQTQARAIAVELSSTAVDNTTLRLQGGIATLDGAQSSGSSVSGLVSGAAASRTGTAPQEGRTVTFMHPADGSSTAGSATPISAGSCGWFAFGHTSTDNANGSVADGLPKAPTNVDALAGNRVTGRLDATGSTTCDLMRFDNLVGGGAQVADADSVGSRLGSAPFAVVRDGTAGSGAVSGGAYVTATALTAVPQQTRAGANTSMNRPVVLFPGSPDSPSGAGLVTAQLTSASVSGVSGTPAAVVGKYVLTLRWRGANVAGGPIGWHEGTYTYDSSLATPLTISGEPWNPSGVFLSNGVKLSDVVFGDAPAAVTTGATSGVRGFPSGIMTLTTASTLENEPVDGYSAIKAQLGQLTCVADDQR